MDMFSNANEFLLWTRGDAFTIAVAVFIVGVLIRVLEIVLLGRKPDLAEPRGTEWGPGLKNIVTRSTVDNGTFKRSSFVVVVGYIWHIGFFIVLFLFIPHIELISSLLGISWPGLSNVLVDSVTAITMFAMLAMLWYRLTNPVLRFLSTYEDYLVWLVTFLPLLTGYIAYHRWISPYPLALGLHILSVELLMIVFPFTKLMHAITVFLSRWYTGAMMGRKGVES
jgi:nitrate reductase gamma subunit